MAAALAAATMFHPEAYAGTDVRITIDKSGKTHEVPKTLWGIFFEDINYAADGGLYPELLQNRGFDWGTQGLHGWENDFRGDAQARVTLESGRPVHQATAKHARIEAFGTGQGRGAGLRNRGYHGLHVEAGKSYDLSFYARGLDGYKGGLRAVLESGDKVLCEYRVPNGEMSIGSPRGAAFFPELPKWKRHSAVFTPGETHSHATFSILLDSPGIVELEQVSLYPQDTFKGRKNGLRRDLAEKLRDLQPGIVRFPGGCLTEGRDWTGWYDWKLSVGDGTLESRTCLWNTWGYWQTMGLGYYEYFCLCEDIGAEPLPVMNAGLTCQFAAPVDAAPMDSMDYFVQNYLDLIEFANGDTSTKWGALRAKMGHPAPFNMKYLGIGNENWGDVFLERFETLAKAVRERHPEIRIVSSSGPGPDGRDFDLAWRRLTTRTADVVDEHYYRPAEWFLAQTRRYDGYDRSGAKPNVYAGEYACHLPGRENNLWSALCEAAAMTGFERNSDVVEMTSYAPLFSKVGGTQWKPDLIWFDNARSFATPNYHVQRLFSVNRPDVFVPSRASAAANGRRADCSGEIGFQTWNTACEFADIKVTTLDGRRLLDATPDPARCRKDAGGRWRLSGGVLGQTATDTTDTALILPCGEVSDAVITFRARRTAGHEGFIFRFRAKNGAYAHMNFGGWENRQHALETKGFTAALPARIDGSISNGRWYKVKITLRGETASVSLDGTTLYKDVAITPGGEDFFHVCGYSKAKGEFIVKCVSLAGEKRRLDIDFGRALPASAVKTATLSGDANVENTLDAPERCAPKESTRSFAGGRVLTATLEPRSLTVFRVRAR